MLSKCGGAGFQQLLYIRFDSDNERRCLGNILEIDGDMKRKLQLNALLGQKHTRYRHTVAKGYRIYCSLYSKWLYSGFRGEHMRGIYGWRYDTNLNVPQIEDYCVSVSTMFHFCESPISIAYFLQIKVKRKVQYGCICVRQNSEVGFCMLRCRNIIISLS